MNPAVLLLLIGPTSPTAADPDESVTAGGEALDRWWNDYPWYDSQTDGMRRIEIPEPSTWSFWDWLGDWMPDWMSGSSGSSSWGFGTVMELAAWTALVVVLCVSAYLLFRAYRERESLSKRSGKNAQSDDGDEERVGALPFPVKRGRMNLLEEAREHYRQGDYAQAIIYLFSFQLVQLDRRQIIRLSKGKTNRQYLREVGARRVLGRLVEQTMVTFEDVFFGNHPLDRPGFESCWSRLDEFESLSAES